MSKKIPNEIECEITPIGGLKGLSTRIPSRKVLNDIAKYFEILSEPIRIQIILVLKEDRLCVCVLKNILSCDGTKLSYHLAVLRHAGIVTCRREKSFLRYSLTPRGTAILSQLLERINSDLKSRPKASALQ